MGIDAYLPVFVKAGLGHSVVVAAFSVAFLTVGWSIASVVMSRLLDIYHEVPAALAGYALLIPCFVVGLSFYDANTPIALVLVVAFALGSGVGMLAMSLLNLLYAVAAPSEIGRATAAHQYVRGLFQTYGAAMVGGVILLVVRDKLGDLEGVRRLLAGGKVAADLATQAAVASGYRLAHVIPLAFSLIGLFATLRLAQRLQQPWKRSAAEAASDERS